MTTSTSTTVVTPNLSNTYLNITEKDQVKQNAVTRQILESGNAVLFDTDATLASNSDALAPTQKAVKAYVTTTVTTLSSQIAQFQPLLSGSFSGSASKDFVLTGLTSTYRAFRFVLTNVGQTDDGSITMRCSTNGGSSFSSSTSQYTHIYDAITGSNVYSSVGLSSAAAVIGWGSSIPAMASAIDLKCYDLNSATNYKKFTSFGTLGSTNTLYTFRGSATFFSTNPVTAIRLLTNGAGTISGNYAIFGIL